MRSEKIFVIMIVLAIFTVGAVSAADVNETSDSLAVVDELSLNDSVSDEVVLSSANDDDSLKASFDSNIVSSPGDGNFTELKTYITGKTSVDLEKNYSYVNGSDNNNGIEIGHNITIDGKNHTIDGAGLARIFKVVGDNVVLKNINFVNADISPSGENGAAIQVDGVDCHIINCSFVNCYAAGGAAIEWDTDATDGVVANCNFVNCSSTAGGYGSGGAINWDANGGAVANCSFVNCYSDYGGGAIYWSSNSGSVSNCSFVKCSSTEYGGAVVFYSNNGDVWNCSFENCSAMNGGAIYFNSYFGKIWNCSFVHCSSTGDGGAILLTGKSDEVWNCSFVDCSATDKGGAIYRYSEDYGAITNCSFENCSAGYGGAIRWDSFWGAVVDCSFVKCSSDNYGGAIYWDAIAAEGSVSNCSFADCSAKFNGGAIYWDAADGVVANCSFKYCSVTFAGDGGAIYWDADSGIVSNCSFVNCSISASESLGGAIYWNGVNGSAVNCSFVNCSSTVNGGAIYWNAADGSVSNSSFMKCSAKNNGGAIYWEGVNGSVADCSFVKCSAVGGGLEGSAIYWDAADGTVGNCSFVNCSTSGYGGAIYWKAADGTVANCSFIDCHSYKNGGAIYWKGVNGSAFNCSFANCFAGSGWNGGAIYWDAADGVVANCSFENCYLSSSTNAYGGAIYWKGINGSAVNCSFVNCSVAGDSDNVGGGAIYWYGVNGSAVNCSFVNCSVTDGNNYFGGGAIYWKGDNGVVFNCSFETCSIIDGGSSVGGGAIYWDAAYGTVANCSFAYCYAKYCGGAIYWDAAYGSVANCSFDGCYLIGNDWTADGGAIYWNSDDNGAVFNCSFVGCSAKFNGGAIYWKSGDNGAVFNCSFVECYVTNSYSSGGAIYWKANGGTVSNSSFVNCYSNNKGGSIYLYGCNVAINNSNFTFSDKSKVIYAENNPDVTVTNCRFKSSITDDPADVYNTATIHDCYLNGNRIDKYNTTITVNCENIRQGMVLDIKVITNVTSGIMQVQINGEEYPINITNGNGSLKISNLDIGNYSLIVSFSGNGNYTPSSTEMAVMVGPAVFEDLQVLIDNADGILTLTNDFYGNGSVINVSKSNLTIDGAGHTLDAKGLSGIFNVTGTCVTLRNFTFINSNVTSSGQSAVYLNSSAGGAVVVDCSFVDCSSKFNGGAIHCNAANGVVADCSFVNCFSTGNGSAIYWNSGDNGSVVDCSFENCSSDEGSAIMFDSDNHNSYIVNCSFLKCVADGSIVQISGNYINMTNCSFVDCFSDYTTVLASDAYLHYFVNCSFVNCSAEFGAIYWSASGFILNCNFTDCSADFGGAIYLDSSDGSVLNCSFVNCTSDADGGAICWNGCSENATVVDCSFVSCSSKQSGGAIYFSYCNVGVFNSTFVNCSVCNNDSQFGGGAIYFDDCGEGVIKNSNFTFSDVDSIVVLSKDVNEDINLFNCRFESSFTDDPATVYQNVTISHCYLNGDRIDKVNTTINVNVGNINYSEVAVVNVTLFSNATGPVSMENIIITLKSGDYTVTANATTDDNGIASCHFANLSAGSYNVTAVFNTHGDYFGSNVSATFIVNKISSVLNVSDVVFDYGSSGSTVISVIGASGVNAVVVDYPEAVVNVEGDTISVSGLGAGNYTLNVTTVPDGNHTGVSVIAGIFVNKVSSVLNVSDVVFDYGGVGSTVVSFSGANDFNDVVVVDHPEAVVNVEGDTISVSGLGAGNYTLSVTTVPDGNHTSVTETASIVVNKADSTLTVENIAFDYGSSGSGAVSFGGASGVDAVVVGHPEAVVDVDVDTISVSGLDVGSYTLNVTTVPDDNHNRISKTASIVVNKADSTLTVENIAFDYGSSGSGAVSFGGASGVVAVVVGHPEAVVSVAGGTISVSGLDVGSYTLNVTTVPDDNHNSISMTSTITVSKRIPSINVTADYIYCGENETVTVTLPDDATGTVDIYLAPDIETTENSTVAYISHDVSNINGGVASITYSDLAVGKYIVNVRYNGDDRYRQVSSSAKFTVFNADLEVNIVADGFTYGENGTVAVYLHSDATGNVSLYLNGTEIANIAVVNAVASYTLTNLDAGTYNIAAYYSGDIKYNPANASSAFEVAKATPQISLECDIGIDAVLITVHSTVDGNVNVQFYGKNYAISIVDGVGSTEVPRPPAGSYDVAATYSGDVNHNSASKTTSINVDLMPTDIILTVNPSSSTLGDSVSITAELMSFNQTLGNIFMDLIIDGGTVGIVSGSPFNYVAQNVGDYVVVARFNGNDYYMASQADKTFSIAKLIPSIAVSANDIIGGENGAVNVALPVDASGDVNIIIRKGTAVVANETVGVNVGVASYVVSGFDTGDYDVNVAYSGDAKYVGVSDSASFKVSKFTTGLTVSAGDIFGGEDETVTVSLAGDATGNVNIIVRKGNAVIVNATAAINNGVASYVVSSMDAGDYDVNVVYSGDSRYLGVSNSTSFKVSKKASSISVSAVDVLYGEDETVIVSLAGDATGNVNIVVVSGGKVIKNVTVAVAGGNASYVISNLVPSDYVVSAAYPGDAKYFNSNASAAFKVSKSTPTLVLLATDIGWGEIETAGATITGSATGNLVFMLSKNGINVINQTVAISNGAASYKFSKLAIGLYNFTAVYAGDDKRNPVSKSITFRVNPSDSFTDLQKLINNAGSVLTLAQDYYGVGTPLVVSKAITIDGAGHTLDANFESRIVNVAAGATFKNIRFINAVDSAVYSTADGVSFINCIFEGSSSDAWGGALHLDGSNCVIEKSTLLNNYALIGGGAVYLNGINNRLTSNIFENNRVPGAAGTLSSVASYNGGDGLLSAVMVDDRLSEEVPTPQGGGAVYDNGKNLEIDNCTFISNSAEGSNGGAVRANDNANIKYSTFRNNTASEGNAIWCKNNAQFASNTFILGEGEQVDDVISGVSSREVLRSSNVYTEDDVLITTPNMEVITADLVFGETETVYAKLPSDARGQVMFKVYSGNKLVSNASAYLNNGVAYCDFAGLTYGVYNVQASYSGDEKYYDNAGSAIFVVRPKVVIAQGVIIENDGNIRMEFADITDSIGVKIDGRLFGVQDIKNGIMDYTFSTTKLGAGNHTVSFTYDGDLFDSNIFKQWDAESQKFVPHEYNMYIAPIKITLKEDVLGSDNDGVVAIELPEDATGTIEVFINGMKYKVVDVVNGLALIDLSEFKDDNYTITFSYSGDSKYSAFTKESVVLLHNPSKISASNKKMVYSSSKTYYSVKVLTKTGKAVEGVTVKFYLKNGKVYKTAKTNKKGIAKIKISGVSAGTYKIKAVASDVSVTKKLTVKHVVSLKKVAVKRSAKKIVLTASLAKVDGKVLKSKKITFKFNGKKYTAKTNKKGIAKVTINSNVIKKLKAGKKVKYQATYLKDTVKLTAKVK